MAFSLFRMFIPAVESGFSFPTTFSLRGVVVKVLSLRSGHGLNHASTWNYPSRRRATYSYPCLVEKAHFAAEASIKDTHVQITRYIAVGISRPVNDRVSNRSRALIALSWNGSNGSSSHWPKPYINPTAHRTDHAELSPAHSLRLIKVGIPVQFAIVDRV